MKKLLPLLLILFSFLSCTNDTNETASEINPNLLQKVIFNPNSAYEKHWNFYPNGLLKEITKPDGSILQSFQYDNLNRLINTVEFNQNNTTVVHNFTYDNNNTILTYNNQSVNYDSNLDIYYIGNLTNSHIEIKLTSDKLVSNIKGVNVDDDGYVSQNTTYNANYEVNNLKNFSQYNSSSCHSFNHDSNINPLKQAILPISRAFSIASNGSFWFNSQFISLNNLTSSHSCFTEDPEHSTYEYNFNAINLPIKQTTKLFYQNNYESSYTSILYYYQGDIIP